MMTTCMDVTRAQLWVQPRQWPVSTLGVQAGKLLQFPDWAAVRARVTLNPGIAAPELCVTTYTPHYLALLIADEAIGR